MKNTFLTPLLCFVFTLTGFTQNNFPVAVNDTIFVEFNDSITFTSINAGGLYINDSDPDGDNIFIDTALYSGAANFSFQTLTTTSTTALVRINYKPSFNYWGIDQIQYILKDDGIPVMYDTATIYVFVKRKTFEKLDINNINAQIDIYSLFCGNDGTFNFASGFEVPKGSGIHSIFSANLWVVGKNQDSIYMNSEMYGSYLSNSWKNSYNHSGPIMDSIYYKNYYDYDWDRVWKVTISQIENHIANWNNGGYMPPQVFQDWPAHGNTALGQAFYLAPFVDNNGDGIYNPFDGDYPKIKGQQAVYFMYNDFRFKLNIAKPMQSEVHGMAYAYNCPSDSAINNTVFLDYTIYNRSDLTYDSTYIGFWSDMDVGNYTDDIVGCDVDRSTYYTYNADDDDNYFVPGLNVYGAYIPAQGVTFLKGAKQDDDGIDNSFGIGPNETVNGFGFGDAITDNEHWGMEYFIFNKQSDTSSFALENGGDYHNYLSGKWNDGTSVVYGGNGHVSGGGTIPARYMFPDSSDSYWYGTAGIPQTPWTDSGGAILKNGIGSTGPFTFFPDSSVEITLALVYGRDYQTTGAKAGVVIMKERIDSIRAYYLADYTPNCYIPPVIPEEPIIPLNEAHVPQAFSPNGDGNNDLLFVYGGPYAKMTFDVYDRWGELVFSTSTQDKGWDGTFKGQKVMSGVYVYLLNAWFLNGKSISEGGNITLVR